SWSHNQEVIGENESEVEPHTSGERSATSPTDTWQGQFIQSAGGQFGGMIKWRMPVWRPRSLFNGQIAFMSVAGYPIKPTDYYRLSYQAGTGMTIFLPCAGIWPGIVFVKGFYVGSQFEDPDQCMSHATPSPCPDHHVVFAALDDADGRYGICLCKDDWDVGRQPIVPQMAEVKILFHDPDLVDSEPVAVYARPI